jgi:hypothetical protein
MGQNTYLLVVALLLVACSTKPRQYSYTAPNSYYPSYSQPARPASTAYPVTPRPVQHPIPHRPLMSFEELARMQIDCSKAPEQQALIEEQIRRRTFYTVSGVEGNSTPNQINKSYYSLAKYRLWTSRFYCQGSEVDQQVIRNDLRAFLNQAPTETRCYFKETTELKASNRQATLLNADQTFIRKETCTNHPYITDRPFIRVGDQLQLGGKGLTGDNFLGGLRKWKGNTYQMISKTEIHQNQAVRFTYVTVRLNAHQWAVVDKF